MDDAKVNAYDMQAMKVIEECSDLIKAISVCKQCGLDQYNFGSQEHPNYLMILVTMKSLSQECKELEERLLKLIPS